MIDGGSAKRQFSKFNLPFVVACMHVNLGRAWLEAAGLVGFCLVRIALGEDPMPCIRMA